MKRGSEADQRALPQPCRALSSFAPTQPHPPHPAPRRRRRPPRCPRQRSHQTRPCTRHHHRCHHHQAQPPQHRRRRQHRPHARRCLRRPLLLRSQHCPQPAVRPRAAPPKTGPQTSLAAATRAGWRAAALAGARGAGPAARGARAGRPAAVRTLPAARTATATRRRRGRAARRWWRPVFFVEEGEGPGLRGEGHGHGYGRGGPSGEDKGGAAMSPLSVRTFSHTYGVIHCRHTRTHLELRAQPRVLPRERRHVRAAVRQSGA